MEALLYRHLEGTPERGADFAAAIRTVRFLILMPCQKHCLSSLDSTKALPVRHAESTLSGRHLLTRMVGQV